MTIIVYTSFSSTIDNIKTYKRLVLSFESCLCDIYRKQWPMKLQEFLAIQYIGIVFIMLFNATGIDASTGVCMYNVTLFVLIFLYFEEQKFLLFSI